MNCNTTHYRANSSSVPGDPTTRKPAQLSGGQRQRAALARCIAKRPRALLLDEPMAALDKHLRERTQLELMALRARLGIAFIVVTHDQSEAMAMADRVAIMDAGRILQIGPPRDIYEHPASRAVAQFFGDINIWNAMVGAVPGTVNVLDLRLTLPVTSPLPAGGAAVAVALRPERIALSRTRGSDGVPATIHDVVYLGAASTYFVKTASGALVRVATRNGEGVGPFARGEAVYLSWPAGALMVLPS